MNHLRSKGQNIDELFYVSQQTESFSRFEDL